MTLDPLYLSASGANMSDLYAMGNVLQKVQYLCLDADAALWIVTHFNRKGGDGITRITGAGPAEWGRVLITANVKIRNTDPHTRATTVETELEIRGGEIEDRSFRVRRRIWSDNPDDLNAPLHIETSILPDEKGLEHVGVGPVDVVPVPVQAPKKLSPLGNKLIAALRAIGPATQKKIGEWIASTYRESEPTREAAFRKLHELKKAGRVNNSLPQGRGRGREAIWSLADSAASSAPADGESGAIPVPDGVLGSVTAAGSVTNPDSSHIPKLHDGETLGKKCDQV